ncbi:hypothetical protein SMGD1_1437 [Sulfurimonas gotlandica GD1]|jgi:ABC-type enterobactin transport system permease subunit|uniref:Uncharacterized protein n=1 Tax=Sulfurimonas gotlandica (strain DSM 19862 / JCM 16533 / GD1) TaxID=929558 RepID=H1FT42_SULGG|nr:hypothetical protein [Sulfurimonas gotlandica]EHP29961.1 hypothetical protein SMGD1_1437 [Sulfurimonas gotlandica GD1]
MLAILKRYSLALLFLLIVVVLMLAGTMGVMSFGDKMLKDSGVEMEPMKPRGEDLTR